MGSILRAAILSRRESSERAIVPIQAFAL